MHIQSGLLSQQRKGKGKHFLQKYVTRHWKKAIEQEAKRADLAQEGLRSEESAARLLVQTSQAASATAQVCSALP